MNILKMIKSKVLLYFLFFALTFYLGMEYGRIRKRRLGSGNFRNYKKKARFSSKPTVKTKGTVEIDRVFPENLLSEITTLDYVSAKAEEPQINSNNLKVNYFQDQLLFQPKIYSQLNKNNNNLNFCSKNTKLFFLKTHKTGSSSVQNLLFRYGNANNLSFAFPKIGHFFAYPLNMDLNLIKNNEKIYDIFALHCRFSKNVLKQYDDHFKFTILRKPSSLLKSAFNYFPHSTPINRANNSIDLFFGSSNSSVIKEKYFYKPMKYSWWAKNLMLYDLGQEDGFYSERLDADENITNSVKQIDQIFDFVMILEHFDESLLVLKKLLCLEFQDIVYVASNQAKMVETVENQQDQESGNRNKNKIQDKNIENWAKADTKLYNHYNQTLWKILDTFYDFKSYGLKKLNQDKQILKNHINNTKNICFIGQGFDKEMAKKFGVWQPRPEVDISYWLVREEQLTNDTCRDLARVETRFIKKLFEKQFVGQKYVSYRN